MSRVVRGLRQVLVPQWGLLLVMALTIVSLAGGESATRLVGGALFILNAVVLVTMVLNRLQRDNDWTFTFWTPLPVHYALLVTLGLGVLVTLPGLGNLFGPPTWPALLLAIAVVAVVVTGARRASGRKTRTRGGETVHPY